MTKIPQNLKITLNPKNDQNTPQTQKMTKIPEYATESSKHNGNTSWQWGSLSQRRAWWYHKMVSKHLLSYPPFPIPPLKGNWESNLSILLKWENASRYLRQVSIIKYVEFRNTCVWFGPKNRPRAEPRFKLRGGQSFLFKNFRKLEC